MTTLPLRITAGVDTHLDVNVVAALDERGALLGVERFDTTVDGYRRTVAWLRGFGTVELVGVEGTGSYGAGLTRYLHDEGVAVVEVDRPNRPNAGHDDAPTTGPLTHPSVMSPCRRSGAPCGCWTPRESIAPSRSPIP